MSLYTGKGDGGTTKVLDSTERIPKASALIECLGSLDELNSFLGLCRARLSGEATILTISGLDTNVRDAVLDIQETLFIMQAEAAGADKQVSAEKVHTLEALTNAVEQIIPPITSFSIPGETELSALFDVARTLARRMERALSAAEQGGYRTFSPETKAYANRLSSVLFAFARLATHVAGNHEHAPTYR